MNFQKVMTYDSLMQEGFKLRDSKLNSVALPFLLNTQGLLCWGSMKMDQASELLTLLKIFIVSRGHRKKHIWNHMLCI